MVFTLPDGPETDLLQYLDRLASPPAQCFPLSVAVVTSPNISSQNHGVPEPAALPGHQGQSDGEPGEFPPLWAATPSSPPLTLPFWGFLQTGIWTELYKIEDTFTKQLRVGVNMSRAHYEMELRNTVEAGKSATKGQRTAPQVPSLRPGETLLAVTSSRLPPQNSPVSPSRSPTRSCPSSRQSPRLR